MSNLADWTFLDAAYRRGLAPEPQTISLGLGRSGGIAVDVHPPGAPGLSRARRPRQGRAGRLLLPPGANRAISARRRLNGSELDEGEAVGRERWATRQRPQYPL
jgi:hypothetical protein